MASGRGQGRGGPTGRHSGGKPKGHLIPQARRSHRHRTRSGKRPRDASVVEDKRFFEDGTAVGEDVTTASSAQPTKKVVKVISAFTEMRISLPDAASIADYIRKNHDSKVFQMSKSLNMFLQAVSNRPDSLYVELINSFKSEVAILLERLYALFSIGKVTMSPSAHEFVIRCEQHGARAASWATGVSPLEGKEPSLFTPRELIKRLAAISPVARLHRQIELCHSVEDIATCAKKLQTLVSTVEDNEGGGLDYATRCQLVSKVISKARRLVTVRPATSADHRSSVEPQAEKEETDASEENAPSMSSAMERVIDLTKAEREQFQDLVHITLRVLRKVLAARPTSTVQQPTAKWVLFSKWCTAHDFIREEDSILVKELEQKWEDDLIKQATQLEAVMRLKELATGDEDALLAVVEELWQAGSGAHLFPCSADILSAIGSAANADTISDKAKQHIASRLVSTQAFHTDGSVTLPRRALRFVHAVRAKKELESLKHRQAETEVSAQKAPEKDEVELDVAPDEDSD